MSHSCIKAATPGAAIAFCAWCCDGILHMACNVSLPHAADSAGWIDAGLLAICSYSNLHTTRKAVSHDPKLLTQRGQSMPGCSQSALTAYCTRHARLFLITPCC